MTDAEPTGASKPSKEARKKRKARLELIATIIMGVAAIMVTWSGFQNNKWSGRHKVLSAQAGGLDRESNLLELEAAQAQVLDYTTFEEFLLAHIKGDEVHANFYRNMLRPEIREVVDGWFEKWEKDPDSVPKTPLHLEEYEAHLSQHQKALELREKRDGVLEQAQEADRNSDHYVYITLIVAFCPFFAGVSTKLKQPGTCYVLLGISAVSLLTGGVICAILPVAT